MKKLLFLLLLLTPLVAAAAEPTVFINEIAWMGTENSSNDEWLELFNSTNNEIDLTGWRLEATDGSPKINLTGKIPAGGYYLLERTDDDTLPEITADQIYTGSLSNTSEWLKLFDASNIVIDEINASTGWPGGDNTTKQTLERKNQMEWQTSEKPGGTPKAANSQAVPTTDEPADNEPTSTPPVATESKGSAGSPPTADSTQKGDIIFNEIFPNPKGSDNEGEFIELKNASATAINLTSWQIVNSAKQTFTLPSLKINPGIIVTFSRPQTGLVLNNSKDKLTLYTQSGKIIDQVEYKSPAPENFSWQKNDLAKWCWDQISPAAENLAKEKILPKAVIAGPKEAQVGEIITFDASDSFDPQNRPLNFSWDFGDGRKDAGIIVNQIYFQPGEYELSLTAEALNQASTTEKLKIKIIGENSAKPEEIKPTSTAPTDTPMLWDQEIPNIFISEFLPSPNDSEDEFVELFNAGQNRVDLGGYLIDDEEGGSKTYKISAGTIIEPSQYLAFFKQQTKIALNNDADTVRLLAPNNQIIDLAKYEKSAAGVSLVLDENFEWQESQTPTPGEINFLQPPAEKEAEKPEILGAETKVETEHPASQPSNKNKYIFAGISTAVALGLGVILKIKH
ncbi:MAG: lamin tail domain-containing protein [Patescibacteria group bacterium]|jgi:hypothetical protein